MTSLETLQRVRVLLTEAEHLLTDLTLRTPTGFVRNQITDIGLHVMSARSINTDLIVHCAGPEALTRAPKLGDPQLPVGVEEAIAKRNALKGLKS